MTAASAKARGVPSERGRFLRIDDVIATTALSRRTIYRMIREGEFPAQHRLSKRAVGWWQGAIDDWLQSRLGPPGAA
ncbi:MAG TPA: AlpA family phage regulatory protein [Sphingomonas sp.]